MPNINITVREKIAHTISDTCIVCGNSDYVAIFDFDAEWDAYATKTARFIWGGTFTDVPFTGNECPVPVIPDAVSVLVGVYAGDLHTTTAAAVEVRRSILGGSETEAEVSHEIKDAFGKMLAGKIDAPQTAQVGQIVSVKSIDESGNITATEAVDMPNRLDVTVSMINGEFVVSHKFAEIKAAYDAGRVVQLIKTPASSSIPYYSFTGFSTGSIGGVAYAYFRYIDYGGNVWLATINSNNEIKFFEGAPFITLYGDVPTDTPKAITYSVVNGIGYADFIPYIEIPSTGDELKERLVISPAYFYVMPNAYAPFVLKNLVNPYTLTRLSYSEPEFGTENNTFEASYLVTDSLGQQIKATCQVLLTESGLGDLVWNFEVRDSLIVKSSTEGSAKKFKITVDDSGTLTATELV